MSETMKIPLKDIRGWLEKETETVFSPIRTKAEKLFENMKERLNDVVDVSKTLFENSRKEIEKRNMKTYRRARALNKLSRIFIERMQHIHVPDEVSYNTLYTFSHEVQDAFAVTEVDIRNWFPRISPYFIFDRRKFMGVFEMAKRTWKGLNDFLAKEYVKTKTLEETFQLIEEISSLKEEAANLEEKREKAENERASVEKRITETERKIADLKNKESMSQLSQVRSEIKTLRMEVKNHLRRLQKPFIKLRSLALRGKGSGLTPEESQKLSQYIKEPFEAFATEQTGYPLLRQILQKLSRLMSTGKLKLKSDRKRKAEKAIKNIVNKGSLVNLHQKCVEALRLMENLSTSARVAEIKNEMEKLQRESEELKRKKKRIESEEKALEQAYKETLEKIQSKKREIEENVLSFLGKRISIE